MADDPAATPEAGAAGAPAPAGAPAAGDADLPWFSALPDDLRGYAEQKGWQDPARAVESYRNLERLKNIDPAKVVQIPDSPDDMGAVWDRLGRPAEPGGYTNALGEGMADEVFSDAAGKAHALGLTDGQFKGMQEWLAQTTEAQHAARAEAYESEFARWQSENRAAFANTSRMLANAGISAEEMQEALNGSPAAFYAALSKVSARMAEGQMVDGDGGAGFEGMSAQAAAAKRDKMLADPAFQKRYHSRDKAVRDGAVAELRPLQEVIANARAGANGADAGSEIDRLKAENAKLRRAAGRVF